MIKFFIRNKKKYVKKDELHQDNMSDIIWIDMLSPTREEIIFIEKNFGVKCPNRQESEEIEISSRYREDNEQIEINSYFLISNDKYTKNETVSLILKNKFLISIQYVSLEIFEEVQRSFFMSNKIFQNGNDILSNILNIRIDIDADTIEQLARDITKIRKLILTDYNNEDEELLEKISHYEDINMKIRENILDKQRILSALLKSQNFKTNFKNELQVMIKDIKSLIEYTQFNFERLEYLQNIFMGVLNIEQNRVVKTFTILNVFFLPPTLIGTIYGMNFDIMPELHWKYGYIFSIVLMLLSAIVPYLIFKKKGWM